VYYQQLYCRDFKGSSAAFGAVLSFCGLLGMMVGFVYFIYYGWTVYWIWAIVAFFVGLVSLILTILVEHIVGKLTLSVAGFLVWPLAAYMMFRQFPN
jgi:hypothetical protein